jgi:hypothetical protein
VPLVSDADPSLNRASAARTGTHVFTRIQMEGQVGRFRQSGPGRQRQRASTPSRTATGAPGAFGDSAVTLGDLRYVVNSHDMAARYIILLRAHPRPSRPAVPAPRARGQRDSYTPADAIFSGGNFSKMSPITRIHGRALRPGPFYRKTRELY